MEICRLCLLNNDHYINIFSEFASNKNVAEIIGKHVGEVNIVFGMQGFDNTLINSRNILR